MHVSGSVESGRWILITLSNSLMKQLKQNRDQRNFFKVRKDTKLNSIKVKGSISILLKGSYLTDTIALQISAFLLIPLLPDGNV